MKLSSEMKLALILASPGGLTRRCGVWLPAGWSGGDAFVTTHTVHALERRGLVRFDAPNHIILIK